MKLVIISWFSVINRWFYNQKWILLCYLCLWLGPGRAPDAWVFALHHQLKPHARPHSPCQRTRTWATLLVWITATSMEKQPVRIWRLSLIAGQSQSMWVEVSLSSPHNRQSGFLQALSCVCGRRGCRDWSEILRGCPSVLACFRYKNNPCSSPSFWDVTQSQTGPNKSH